MAAPATKAVKEPSWTSKNRKAMLRPFPTVQQVMQERVWISPIDNWAERDGAREGLHRPTFRGFHWRAFGPEAKELAPETPLNEAFLIVTSGEVDLWSEGHSPTRVSAKDRVAIAWIGNASRQPWLPQTYLKVADGGEAHGMLFAIGEEGVPHLPVSRSPADGIRFATARSCEKETHDKMNYNHGWRPAHFNVSTSPGLDRWANQLLPLSTNELDNYPHHSAIHYGNMKLMELAGWRKLREGKTPRRPRTLFRIIQFPPLRGDYRIGMATHNGVEAIIALNGAIDTYMCPMERLESQEPRGVQLAELKRDKVDYEHVHLSAAGNGRPSVLMLRPSHLHHAVVACHEEAFALLVGAANLEWKEGWLDLIQQDELSEGALK